MKKKLIQTEQIQNILTHIISIYNLSINESM